MRDNSKDRTIERDYIQKRRFLIKEYQLVKAKRHPPSSKTEYRPVLLRAGQTGV